MRVSIVGSSADKAACSPHTRYANRPLTKQMRRPVVVYREATGRLKVKQEPVSGVEHTVITPRWAWATV